MVTSCAPKTWLSFAGILLLVFSGRVEAQVLNPASAQPPGQFPSAETSWNPEWEPEMRPEPWIHVTGQLLWLARDTTEIAQTLVYETYGTLADPFQLTLTQAQSDDLDFDVEAGFRGSVLLGPAFSRQLELSYMGVYDHSAAMTLTIPPPGAPPADPNEVRLTGSGIRFFNTDLVSTTLYDWSLSYNSTLHSAEMNLWLDTEWRFRPLVGLRWIHQSEQFDILATNDTSVGGTSNLTNNLVGGQIGFLCVIWRRTDWFRVQAICKAAWYQNDIDYQADLFSTGVTLGSMQNDDSSPAWSGEINVTAVWQLGPHVNFHVGYSGLWLTEVASIGDQFNDLDIATGAGRLDLGGVSYQGGHLGVTVTW